MFELNHFKNVSVDINVLVIAGKEQLDLDTILLPLSQRLLTAGIVFQPDTMDETFKPELFKRETVELQKKDA